MSLTIDLIVACAPPTVFLAWWKLRGKRDRLDALTIATLNPVAHWTTEVDRRLVQLEEIRNLATAPAVAEPSRRAEPVTPAFR